MLARGIAEGRADWRRQGSACTEWRMAEAVAGPVRWRGAGRERSAPRVRHSAAPTSSRRQPPIHQPADAAS